MKVYRESVQVTDMEGAKVCMERIVQEQTIDIEINGGLGLVLSGGSTRASSLLAGRLWRRCEKRKGSILGGWAMIRSQVKAI